MQARIVKPTANRIRGRKKRRRRMRRGSKWVDLETRERRTRGKRRNWGRRSGQEKKARNAQ